MNNWRKNVAMEATNWSYQNRRDLSYQWRFLFICYLDIDIKFNRLLNSLFPFYFSMLSVFLYCLIFFWHLLLSHFLRELYDNGRLIASLCTCLIYFYYFFFCFLCFFTLSSALFLNFFIFPFFFIFHSNFLLLFYSIFSFFSLFCSLFSCFFSSLFLFSFFSSFIFFCSR